MSSPAFLVQQSFLFELTKAVRRISQRQEEAKGQGQGQAGSERTDRGPRFRPSIADKSETSGLSSSKVWSCILQSVHLQLLIGSRRHRRRKAEYAQSLEAEIAKIKDQHYKASEDAQRLASENAEISSYLVSQGFLSGSDQIPFVQTSSMEQEVLDPDLALECPNLSELSSGLDSESDGALSSLDEAPLSSCRDKSYILLKESDFPDPQTDALSRSKIKQCRDLLLESVHPFQ